MATTAGEWVPENKFVWPWGEFDDGVEIEALWVHAASGWQVTTFYARDDANKTWRSVGPHGDGKPTGMFVLEGVRRAALSKATGEQQ